MRKVWIWMPVLALAMVVGACGEKETAAPARSAAVSAAPAEATEPAAAAEQPVPASAQSIPAAGPPAAPVPAAEVPADEVPRISAAPTPEATAKAERRKKNNVASPNAPGPDEKVVAWNDRHKITLDEFARYLGRLPPFQRREYAATEKKLELLKNLIRFETLAEQAEAEGFLDDPDVQLALRTEMIKKYLQTKYGEDAQVQIPDDEVRARYDQEIGRYRKPERVRASHLLIRDKARAQTALKELKAELGKSGANTRLVFREVVKKYSEDETTRARGGDLLFFARDGSSDAGQTLDPAVVNAAFAIQATDQVSTLIEGKDGWHILLLTNRRDAVERPFEEVKEEIRDGMRRETLDRQRREFMDKLVDFDTWHMELPVLSQVKVDGNPPGYDVRARVESVDEMAAPAEAVLP